MAGRPFSGGPRATPPNVRRAEGSSAPRAGVGLRRWHKADRARLGGYRPAALPPEAVRYGAAWPGRGAARERGRRRRGSQCSGRPCGRGAGSPSDAGRLLRLPAGVAVPEAVRWHRPACLRRRSQPGWHVGPHWRWWRAWGRECRGRGTRSRLFCRLCCRDGGSRQKSRTDSWGVTYSTLQRETSEVARRHSAPAVSRRF